MLRDLDPQPARTLEVVVLLLATTFATATRYVALRTWVVAGAARPKLRPIPD